MSFSSAFFGFMKGERSQTELDAYRNAMRHIDDLEAAIQQQVLAAPLPPGKGPWDRPLHQQQALAFTWIARALATISTTMLESDAREDPGTAGYLPLVTFGQVKELYTQVPHYIQRAWEAMANPRYRADKPLPLPLGPRIEAEGRCPDIHLKGIYAAGLALDQLGQARLAGFLQSVQSCGVEPPEEIKHFLGDLSGMWARAQSKVAFSHQQLAMVVNSRNLPLETHEEAELRLWDACAEHFLVGQFVCMPALAKSAALAGVNATGRQVSHEERWCLTDPAAVQDLRNTKFGEMEIREFWVRKAWRTTPREERYLAQIDALKREGSISVVSRWSTTPFGSVWQTLAPINLLDTPIDRGHEFHFDMNENADELQLGKPRFRRTKGYEEEHEEGHVDGTAGEHH